MHTSSSAESCRTDSVRVACHSTHNISIGVVKVIVTDCAPLAVVEHLHSSKEVSSTAVRGHKSDGVVGWSHCSRRKRVKLYTSTKTHNP